MQEECVLVKLDFKFQVQGDVIIECFHLEDDLIREEMIFRVMFHTAFIRSNRLKLNRDDVDAPWDVKVQFPKEFMAEVGSLLTLKLVFIFVRWFLYRI